MIGQGKVVGISRRLEARRSPVGRFAGYRVAEMQRVDNHKGAVTDIYLSIANYNQRVVKS
jgi:hypothetical protein